MLTFVQKIEGIGFSEAVERLADRYGVQLRYVDEGSTGARRDQAIAASGSASSRRTRAATEFYIDQLASPDAVAGRQFLSERGFDKDAAEHVRRSASRRAGERRCCATCAAAASPTTSSSPPGWSRQRQRGPYDRFRGRLLWPIRELSGDVSASARGGCSTTTGSRRST